jgi:hypothetical protein
MYSQKTYKTKLGTCTDTISQSGCLITSWANFISVKRGSKLPPDSLNAIFKDNGFYSNGCLINLAKVAKFYDFEYSKIFKAPNEICIAETNQYAKLGIPQHFFLYDPKNKLRVDPLDLKPDWEFNNYPIVSYRVFKDLKIAPKPTEKPKEASMPTPEVKTPQIATSEPTKQPEQVTDSSKMVLDNISEVIAKEAPKTFWQKIADAVRIFFNI